LLLVKIKRFNSSGPNQRARPTNVAQAARAHVIDLRKDP
jgi:hypothetical protein